MWFKVDDEAWMSDALQSLSCEALSLWVMVGSRCGHDNTEGRITPVILRQVRKLFGIPPAAVDELVAAGRWHDATTIRRCATCKRIPPMLADGKLKPGEFYVHNWLEYQFTRDQALLPEHRLHAVRKKRLSNNTELREQLYLRDKGLCRYCGVRVDFKDRHGPTGGTWDHRDPAGENTLDNVLTACRRCNSLKNNRTPEEAGMPVLAPGQALGQTDGQTGVEPEPDGRPTTRGRTREFGTGRTGDQPTTDPGRDLGEGGA